MSADSGPSFTPPDSFQTRPTLQGSFGMSASTHWIATAVAQSVLERGGNAFDAAVAAGFVLHVVEPHLNGPGGDMVMLIAPDGTRPQVVCGQGPAPEAATIEHYRSEGLEMVPGAGALAAAVPGAVEAWLWLLKEHGTWDVVDVLEYAIGYAEAGHPLVAGAAAAIATMAEHFQAHWPTSAATWLIDGRPPEPGEMVKNPAYAQTLRRLLAGAGEATRESRIENVIREWKTGFVAAAIVDDCHVPHRHSTGGDHSGVMELSDIAEFEVRAEPPVMLEFRGRTIVKAPFWSQGPVLLQALAILDQFGDRELDPGTADGAHTIIEALKLAMADRDAYYGDAHDSTELLAHLISSDYARQRAALIGAEASGEFRPGVIPGLSPYYPPLRTEEAQEAIGVGEPTVRPTGETRGDTVHLDVVDRWGNLVSATPSGGWLQSNPTIPELGFCLGTRLQMTWLDEHSPSALRPGRRPRTTLTPTIVLDGDTSLALGSPGGDQQDQWQLLFLLRTIVGGYTAQQAIDAPMFNTTSVAQSFWPRLWTPRGVLIEERAGTTVIEGLRDRGHAVSVSGPWTLGRLSCVSRDARNGLVVAAANPRGSQGYAAGR